VRAGHEHNMPVHWLAHELPGGACRLCDSRLMRQMASQQGACHDAAADSLFAYCCAVRACTQHQHIELYTVIADSGFSHSATMHILETCNHPCSYMSVTARGLQGVMSGETGHLITRPSPPAPRQRTPGAADISFALESSPAAAATKCCAVPRESCSQACCTLPDLLNA
jgi:hypothetical protein